MAQVIISMEEYNEYLDLKSSKSKIKPLNCEKRYVDNIMGIGAEKILNVRVKQNDIINLLKQIGAIPKETDKLFYE